MTSVPLCTFLTDVAVVSSDLLTGKSIPVLVGITRLPVDQFLACTVLSMGAVAGALFSFYSSHHAQGMHPLGHLNRLAQLFFALFLSLSLQLSLSRGIHYARGVILSLIPAFCVASQSLPQRAATPWVAILASLGVFLYCMAVPVPASADPGLVEEGLLLPRVLRGLQEGGEVEVAGVWDVVLRAVQLFVLAFYACVQHAPTQVYCGCGAEEDRHAAYASHAHAQSRHYSLFVGLTSALLRVSLWYCVCLFQNNALHVMLENDLSRGGWDWAGCALYSALLLFCACWTATQIREQVLPLPVFRVSSVPGRLKLLVCALALAALYRQRDAQLVFSLTAGLSAASVVVTGVTLRDW
jgi:hypothetical protein